MSDTLLFVEGANELINSGLPSTITFALSRKAIGTLITTDTYAGGFGEINTLVSGTTYTCTGYARITQSEPTASNAGVTFAQLEWLTVSATNWPPDVKTCVMLDAGTSKLLYAWHLVAGGTSVDMSTAATAERFTPALLFSGG